ncbi:hypothetical protein [Ornatilinea apprima]|nr:hypothetical protein [Ornatilinea apprima]
MNHPAEPLQLSPEEQGRLLARVYAFILSDQFIGTQQEPYNQLGKQPTKERKKSTTGNATDIDAETIANQEPNE